jgi:hypothetical protein
VGTLAGTTMTLYLNGQSVATQSVTGFKPNTARPFRVGMGATEGAGDYGFVGSVDNVGFYNRALTATEVALHWAAGQ